MNSNVLGLLLIGIVFFTAGYWVARSKYKALADELNETLRRRNYRENGKH